MKINNDKAHGWLAALAVWLGFNFLWFVAGRHLAPVYGPPFALFFSYAGAVALAYMLQSANEAYQSIDKNVGKKYGGYRNFQKNSRADWRWFWKGVLLSWLLPALQALIFLK